MKKGKLILGFSIVIALAPAALLYFNWNPESLLRLGEEAVTMADIEEKGGEACIGFSAGEDIPRLTGEEDMKTTLEAAFTAEPTDVVYTGAYSLKPWVESYTYNRTRKGRRYGAPRAKPRFLQYKNPDGLFQNHADYLPFYLLKFSDDTYILAQIPESDAKAIRKGKAVTLPVGKKVSKGIPETLSNLCEEYSVYTGGIYYAFNDEWQEKHEFIVFLLRMIVVSVVFFGIAISFILLGNKVFHVEE